MIVDFFNISIVITETEVSQVVLNTYTYEVLNVAIPWWQAHPPSNLLSEVVDLIIFEFCQDNLKTAIITE